MTPRPGLPLTIEASAWLALPVADVRATAAARSSSCRATSRDRSLVGGGQLLFAQRARRAPRARAAPRRQPRDASARPTRSARAGVAPGSQPDRTRLRGTVAAEDEILLLGDRVSIVPGLRWEGLPATRLLADPRLPAVLGESGTVDRSVWSPRLGAARARRGPGVTLLGNVGRYARVPNLQELFGDAGVVRRQSRLSSRRRASTGTSASALARAQLGPVISMASFEFAYFDNRIDDVIVRRADQRERRSPAENISAATVRGPGGLAARSGSGSASGSRPTTRTRTRSTRATSRSGAATSFPGRPGARGLRARSSSRGRATHPLPVGALGARLWPGRV